MQLKAAEKPTAGNLVTANAEIETYFGDLLSIQFTDQQRAPNRARENK